MSDIRFNQWLHQSGTGGVSQSDGGHVGIGTTNPLIPVGAGNTHILNVGVVTCNNISAGSSITAGTFYGSGANLSSLNVTAIKSGGSVKAQANADGVFVTGILTATNFKTGVSNLHNLGLTLSSGQLDIGSNIKAGSAGVITATSFSGDGSNLTGISGVTINNNANNRLITGSGTANTLEGESDLTFDGNQLYIDCNNYAYPLVVNSTQSSVRAVIRQTNDANANSGLAIQKKHSSLHPANHWYGDLSFEGWDGSGYHKAGLIECVAEGTPANDNMPGGLRFSTNAGAAGVTERLRIKPDGNVEVKTGNLVMTSGKGIDFSADGSGTLKSLPNSFNAELLHDYENGTFTPNIQYDTGTNRYAGSNVSSATGEYIRIGDLVNFGCKITLTGNRNYSENIHLYIGGFPYNGLHSSQQSSMMTGWSGWACPTNDSNSSYKLHYCYHSYTTVNLRFSQSSGTGGISGFYVWGFYRTAP